MVKFISACFVLATALTLATANDVPATSQDVTSLPAIVGQSIVGSKSQDEARSIADIPTSTNVAISSPDGNQDASSEASLVPKAFKEEPQTEIESWSFCSEGWLLALSWLGLCPDHYNFADVEDPNTIYTMTSTRTPGQHATRQNASSGISTSTAMVTKTKLIRLTSTETTTEKSIQVELETSTKTATETSTETSTKIVKVESTSTISLTISAAAEVQLPAPLTVTETSVSTSIIHVPTTVSIADPDTICLNASSPITVTSTSTSTSVSTWTTTSLTQATVTVISWEDGIHPNNTECFGGGFVPFIQQEGCSNFHALHWAERLMILAQSIMTPCLALFALEVVATSLFKKLVRGPNVPREEYKSPFDDPGNPDDPTSGAAHTPPAEGEEFHTPDSPAVHEEDLPLIPRETPPAQNLQIVRQATPEAMPLPQVEVDKTALATIQAFREQVVSTLVCQRDSPQLGCFIRVELDLHEKDFSPEDFRKAKELSEKMYPVNWNLDIRQEETPNKINPDAVQRTGPQNLHQVQERVRQWAIANHDLDTAKEIQDFVDEHMVPEAPDRDPLFVTNIVEKLVGWSSGYGIVGPMPLWRIQLETALTARAEEHDAGLPWSPQFEGNDDLFEEKRKYDARWAALNPEAEGALEGITDCTLQIEGPKESTEHADEQESIREIEAAPVSAPTAPPMAITFLPSSGPGTNSDKRRVSASILLTEFPMSPEISPTTISPLPPLQLRLQLEAAQAAQEAAQAASAATEQSTNDITTTTEPKKQKVKRRNPMMNKGGPSPTTPTSAGLGRKKSEGKDPLRRR